MTKKRALIGLVLIGFLGACGGDESGDEAGDGGGSTECTDCPSCADGEIKVIGSIDGTAIDLTLVMTGYGLDQLSDPKSLALSTTTGDTLEFFWDEILADGSSTEARAQANLVSAGAAGGNCETASSDSHLWFTGDDDGTFEIKNMNSSPFCSGGSVSGTLKGCYNFSFGG